MGIVACARLFLFFIFFLCVVFCVCRVHTILFLQIIKSYYNLHVYLFVSCERNFSLKKFEMFVVYGNSDDDDDNIAGGEMPSQLVHLKIFFRILDARVV